MTTKSCMKQIKEKAEIIKRSNFFSTVFMTMETETFHFQVHSSFFLKLKMPPSNGVKVLKNKIFFVYFLKEKKNIYFWNKKVYIDV